jgi:hypothetical protein
MKKRLIFIPGLLTLAAAMALLVLWLVPACPAVTKANFDRIEIGMSLAQVEAILGTDRGDRGIPACDEEGHILLEWDEAMWSGNDGIALIALDEHGQVVRNRWRDDPLPFFKQIWRWPGLHLRAICDYTKNHAAQNLKEGEGGKDSFTPLPL